MSVSPDFPLSPWQVAKPLDVVRAWRLPDDGDLVVLHQDALRVLDAMETLAQLELPLQVVHDGAGAEQSASAVHTLLADVERNLAGPAHRHRIRDVTLRSPGHGVQLERTRRQALAHVRSLRMRVDFICGGRHWRHGVAAKQRPASWLEPAADAPLQ